MIFKNPGGRAKSTLPKGMQMKEHNYSRTLSQVSGNTVATQEKLPQWFNVSDKHTELTKMLLTQDETKRQQRHKFKVKFI